MTSKIQIDDRHGWRMRELIAGRTQHFLTVDMVKEMLQEVLNLPPEEPEIPVPREVTQVGLNAFHHDWAEKWGNNDLHTAMARAYRAASAMKTVRQLDDIEAEALSAFHGCPSPHNCWLSHERHNMARALYVMERAMEKARRKEEGQPTFPRGPFYSHSRKGEENCTRTGHRRKDDPK